MSKKPEVKSPIPMTVIKPNFEKGDGLVPVIVQDIQGGTVLMLAYTDEAGWKATLESGYVTLFSRSRGVPWTKGEESGNYQKVVAMYIDCDGDSLIYRVEQLGKDGSVGVACHTDAYTCFYRTIDNRQIFTAPKAGHKELLPFVSMLVTPDVIDRHEQ